MNPFVILEYIKNSIDILINLKVEERLESEKNVEINNTTENEYEVLLRKLESDIRIHIKVKDILENNLSIILFRLNIS